MTRRTCPACTKRYAGTVDPECPVCEGVGVLALGEPAMYRTTPESVARAIELYLETACRQAAADLPPNALRGDSLTLAAQRLRTAGVIGEPLGVKGQVVEPTETPDDPTGPAQRVADYHAMRLATELGYAPTPADVVNTDADQIVYGPDDRPRATGLLPTTSAEGWPSFLARAADPTDPLGPSTRELVYERQSRDRVGAVIAGAVDRVVEIKERRTRRPGIAAAAVAPLSVSTAALGAIGRA